MSNESTVLWSQSIVIVMLEAGVIIKPYPTVEQLKKHVKHIYLCDEYIPFSTNGNKEPIVEVRQKPDKSYDTFIRFYANEKHLEKGRETEQKLGRYLNKFYSEHSKRVVDKMIDYARSHIPAPVQFTKNGKESVQVYIDGPSSCMSGSPDQNEFDSYPYHPAMVYDITKGDLCIAYLKNNYGDIKARVVCWPEKKIFSTIYGDTVLMRKALKDLEYVNSDRSFAGAKLPYIPFKKGHENFIFPYFDDLNYVSVLANHKYVVVHDRFDGSDIPNNPCLDRTLSAKSQSGLVPEYSGEQCIDCDNYSEDGRYIDDEYVCDRCLEDNYVFCEHCEDVRHVDSAVYSEITDRCYCESCYSVLFTQCDYCRSETMCEVIEETQDGYEACPDCATECENCEDIIASKESNNFEGQEVCSDCYKELEEEGK